jgi:hypothetical protein
VAIEIIKNRKAVAGAFFALPLLIATLANDQGRKSAAGSKGPRYPSRSELSKLGRFPERLRAAVAGNG